MLVSTLHLASAASPTEQIMRRPARIGFALSGDRARQRVFTREPPHIR